MDRVRANWGGQLKVEMNVAADVLVVLQHDAEEEGTAVLNDRLSRGDHTITWQMRDARAGLWHVFVAMDDEMSEHATFYVSGGE